MIILDTDCLSLIDREKILESSILRRNLENYAPDEIFTTIITFEENMRGWLSFIARSKTLDQQIYALRDFNFSRFQAAFRVSRQLATPL